MILPVPLSPNRWKSNPFARQAQKDEHRKAVWTAALAQGRPTRDPPQRVHVRAVFYLCKLRDEENLVTKWTTDALTQRQAGAMRWRQGIADKCGYMIDDDPAHFTMDKPTQVKVRTRKEERLELTITDTCQGGENAPN